MKLSPASRQALLRRGRALALLASSGLLLPLLRPFYAENPGTPGWLLDLASHWQWFYFALLLPSAGLCAALKSRWAALLLFLPLPWLSATPTAPRQANAPIQLSLISANLHQDASTLKKLSPWLREAKPDLLILLEVTPAIAAALADLPGYPQRIIEARDDPFGIALLSTHPLLQPAVLRDADGLARIEAQLKLGQQTVRLIASHPMPPLSRYFLQRGIAELRAQSTAAATSDLPSILAGDLNATPWSAAFFALGEHGLRRASGLAPTWPAMTQGWLGIPIDHVLVSQHWRVLATERGPDIGSDHLPILSRLALARQTHQTPTAISPPRP